MELLGRLAQSKQSFSPFFLFHQELVVKIYEVLLLDPPRALLGCGLSQSLVVRLGDAYSVVHIIVVRKLNDVRLA